MSSTQDAPAVITAATEWTAGKSIVATIGTLIATSAAPYVAEKLSTWNVDPEWIKNCAGPSSLSMFAVAGFAVVSAGAVGGWTYIKRNFIKN